MSVSHNREFIAENVVNSIMKDVAGDQFPSCVAAVLADPHGFLVAGHKKQGLNIPEEMLALQAVSDENIINLYGFQQFRKQLSKELNLLLIAKKDRYNLSNYNKLMKILKINSVF